MKQPSSFSLLVLWIALAAIPATATSFFAIDEFGNGLPSHQGFDPGPGATFGNHSLIFTLPFAARQGDVFVIDPTTSQRGDWLRFNGDFTVIFYSDGSDFDGFPFPPADIGFPASQYPSVSISESGTPEVNAFAAYTPTSTQPGFDASNPSYLFQSDGPLPVPEPSAFGPMTLALAAAALGLRPSARIIRQWKISFSMVYRTRQMN